MNDKDLLIENLNLIKDSEDPRMLFKAMDIIILLSDEDKLNIFVEKNKQKLLNNDPVRFIGLHVDFYVRQDKLLEGLKVLESYQEAPFINLTTEDFMKELHEKLLSLIYPKKKSVDYNEDKLISDLYSTNEDKILHAIKYLSNCNVRNYLDIIEKALVSNLFYRYKILLQFVLIEQGINKKVCVKLDNGELFYFVPSQTSLPFQVEEYKTCVNYIAKLNESPSVIDNALRLVNMIEVKVFPFSFLKRYSSPLIAAEIIIYLTKKLLLENPDINELIKNTGLDNQEIDQVLEELNNII